MTNIAIVDDDIHFLNMLKEKILKLDNNLNIFCYNEPYEFTDNLYNVDYVLLDIDLPQIDGISLSKQLRNSNISIFFITTYEEFMIKAFGKNVEGFIIKDNLDEGIDNFLKFISYNKKNNYVRIHTLQYDINISYNDIIYINYFLRDIEFHLANNKKVLQKNTNLKDIISQLDDKFVLINRDIIVNLDFVDDLKNGFIFIRKNKFKVSRRKIKNIKIKLLERQIYNE